MRVGAADADDARVGHFSLLGFKRLMLMMLGLVVLFCERWGG